MNQNPQTPSLPVAPPPPTWVSFDSDFKINIEWQTVPGAIAYDLEVSGQPPLRQPIGLGTTGFIQCNAADGEIKEIRLGYYNATDSLSQLSSKVSFLCANFPNAPSPPTIVLNTQLLILIQWQPPNFDGGSPILGYMLYMSSTNHPSQVLIYNGTGNPTTKDYGIRSFLESPLEITSYYVQVRAINWVGTSDSTAPTLQIIVNLDTSPIYSQIDGSFLLRDANNLLTGNGQIQAAVLYDIYMQAYDQDNNILLKGGSYIFLNIEELCTVTVNYRCDRVPNQKDVLNGTIKQFLYDFTTGRYQSTFQIVRPGLTTLSLVLKRAGGFYGEYFNNAFLQGVPALNRLDNYLNFNWGDELITNEAADFVSIQWFGSIKPPTTEQYTFIVSADDGVRVIINENLVIDRWDTCCDDTSFEMDLDSTKFYDIVIQYKEIQEKAYFKLEWVSIQIPRQVVPPLYVYYPTRINNRVFTLQTTSGPTIPQMCTAAGTGLQNGQVGKMQFFYIYSRDYDGNLLANTNDQYLIEFFGPAEGLPTGVVDSLEFTAIGVSTSISGEYLVQYLPRYSGTYILSIKLYNTKISGSDWKVIIQPGEILAPVSSLSLNTLPYTIEAGQTKFFFLTLRDVYQNLIKDRRYNTTVDISLIYINNNAWISNQVTNFPDIPNWPQLYGTNVKGLAYFKNDSIEYPDGSYMAQFTLFKAGLFTLDIRINNLKINSSPFTNMVNIIPADFYAPYSKILPFPQTMTAGTTYSVNMNYR